MAQSSDPSSNRPNWLDLSDVFEAAIGRIIVTFGHLEGGMRFFLYALISGDHKKISALTSTLEFRRLVPAISAQVHIATKDPAHLETIQTWALRAESLAARRNRFVHDRLVFRHLEAGKVRPGHYRKQHGKGNLHAR
jgi:hypothetical protein